MVDRVASLVCGPVETEGLGSMEHMGTDCL